MGGIILTKDADYLICKIYESYLTNLENSVSRSDSKKIGDYKEIQEKLIPEWSLDDIKEVSKSLKTANLINQPYLHEGLEFTDEGIIYMENRFSNDIKKLVNWILKLIPLVFH